QEVEVRQPVARGARDRESIRHEAEELQRHLDRDVLANRWVQPVEARLAPLFRLLVEQGELFTEALFGADTPRRLDLNREPLRILVRDRLQQRPEATLEPDLDEA